MCKPHHSNMQKLYVPASLKVILQKVHYSLNNISNIYINTSNNSVHIWVVERNDKKNNSHQHVLLILNRQQKSFDMLMITCVECNYE